MGITVVTHSTALMLCREMRTKGAEFKPTRVEKSKVVSTETAQTRELVVSYLAEMWPARDLHILVCERERRHRIKDVVVHCSDMQFEKGSFVRLTPSIVMSGPELLFFQMASMLEYEQLFLLGLELCGTFSINARFDRGFANGLVPVTSPKKLRDFAEKARGLHGSKKVHCVLDRLESDSASPQESRLYMKLAGPRSIGAYNVQGLRFNYEVRLSPDAMRIAGQRICRVDLADVDAKLAIEYESAMEHENSLQGQKDKRRRDALTCDGWVVKSVVPALMSNPELFDAFARGVLAQIGRSERIRVKEFECKREKLFRKLAIPD